MAAGTGAHVALDPWGRVFDLIRARGAVAAAAPAACTITRRISPGEAGSRSAFTVVQARKVIGASYVVQVAWVFDGTEIGSNAALQFYGKVRSNIPADLSF